MKNIEAQVLVDAITAFHAENAAQEGCTAEACVAALGKQGYAGDVRVIHGYDHSAPADLKENQAVVAVAGRPIVGCRFNVGEWKEDEQVWDSRSSLGDRGSALVSFR